MPDEKKRIDRTLEWTFCTAHGTSTVNGSCDACGGDRCLIQVVPKEALEEAQADWRNACDVGRRLETELKAKCDELAQVEKDVETMEHEFDEERAEATDEQDRLSDAIAILTLERANVVNALGLGEDIDTGRDLVEACHAERRRFNMAVDVGLRLTAELEAAKAVAGHIERMGAARHDDCNRLTAELAAAKAADQCDACLGTGMPISGKPCMCQGTGRMSDAARWLREELVKADTDVAAAKADALQAHEEVGMLATAVLAAWQNKDVQELARIIVIAKDGWPSVSLAIAAPPKAIDAEPACPGPHCLACNGEACETCGAGMTSDPNRPKCEHGTIERHTRPVAAQLPLVGLTTVDHARTVYAIHHRGDAHGRRCTSFINAETDEEAKARATELGMVPVEYVKRLSKHRCGRRHACLGCEDCLTDDPTAPSVDPRESMVPLEGEEPREEPVLCAQCDGKGWYQRIDANDPMGHMRYTCLVCDERHTCNRCGLTKSDCDQHAKGGCNDTVDPSLGALLAPPKVEGPPAEVTLAVCPATFAVSEFEPGDDDPQYGFLKVDYVLASTLSSALDALEELEQSLEHVSASGGTVAEAIERLQGARAAAVALLKGRAR